MLVFNLEKLPEISNLKLSELGFYDIEYIPLETDEQCLLKRSINLGSLGDKILVEDGYFIVEHFNTILKFRDDGSFVTKIGNEGRGPNEFQACNDIEIDENGKIFIVDGWKQKLFIYSPDGKFLRTVNFPFEGPVEYKYAEGMFLCYSQNNLGNIVNSFNLVTKEGDLVKSFPNSYPYVKTKNDAYGFNHEILFYRFNNRLFKKEVYSDTIYQYENREFKPHILIKTGDRLITTKARSELAGQDLAKNYISPRNLFEFGEFIYYEFTYKFDFSKTLTYSFIGSKKTDFKSLFNTETGIINDLDGGPNILPQTIKDDNTIITMIDALKIKNLVASDTFKNSKPKFPEKKKELEKLANSLQETDNPVLMLVRLKK